MPCVPRQVEKFRNHSATPTTSPVVVPATWPKSAGESPNRHAGELLLGEVHLVQRPLVVGQLAHQPDDRRDVVGPDRPHAS